MSLIVFAIVVLLIAGILIYAVQLVTFVSLPLRQLIMALILVLAAVAIAQKAGVF
jgi:hypothetical protein